MPSAPENVPAEEAAWAEVLHAWEDEASHRAYLDRFADLDGLAEAGRRYREVLAERPGDAIAARFRDEVVKRAMARALVAAPRKEPAHRERSTVVRALLVAVAVGLGAATWWVVVRIHTLAGAVP